MRKFLSEAVGVLKTAALYDLLIAFSFFGFSAIYSAVEGRGEVGISLPQYAMIFLFASILALCSLVFRLSSLERWLRRLIHFAISLVSFFVIFILFGKISFEFSRILILSILFAAIYFAVVGISFLLRKLIGTEPVENKNESTKKEPYQSMF